MNYPWSFTILSTYEQCPRKKKYRYDDRIKAVTGPAGIRGKDAHQTAEDFLNEKTTVLHEVVEPYRHVLDHVRRNDPFVEFRIAVTKGWKHCNWSDAWGRCVIDSAYVYGDRVKVQEWKTGKVWDEHQEQRKLYLLFSMVQWPVASTYRIQSYYFDLGKKKSLELTKDDAKPIRDDFNARITIMEADDIMAPRPGPYCGYCPYSRLKGGPCRAG